MAVNQSFKNLEKQVLRLTLQLRLLHPLAQLLHKEQVLPTRKLTQITVFFSLLPVEDFRRYFTDLKTHL